MEGLRIPLAVLLLLGMMDALEAGEPARLRVDAPSLPTIAPDGVTPADRLALDPKVVAALLDVLPGESIRLLEWPLAPGLRADVLLTRQDVYASDAIVYRVEGEKWTAVPRSELVFLWGEAENGERTRVVVSADPETRTLHGYASTTDGWVEMRAVEDAPGEYLVAPLRGFLGPLADRPAFTCGEQDLPEAPPFAPSQTEAITTLHKATLAVDTDNEFMLVKFADDTMSATNYIASLFALMTVIYERDLRVRLLQGTTFLRVSTMPDPYNAQSAPGAANITQLAEFRNYWMANYPGVSRAAAMMLSGKQADAYAASGIAYVNSLCSFTSGYSFSQVFKFPGSTASSDTLVVAHENGHNFGSKHTHCYLNPTPIDMCYNQESGCYSGPTSCPAPQTINGVTNVRGTLMSYCHTLAGCSSSTVFHPRTVAILDPIVQSKVGVCVFPVANPKEASPAKNMTARRGSGTAVSVTYTPACGASNHTVHAGSLNTLRTTGIAWSQRFCSLGTSGSLTFDPGSSSVYFVVVGNNGSVEGSYGRGSSGERPPAGTGGACSYTQDLSGTCP